MAGSPSPRAARAIFVALLAATLLALLLHIGYGSTSMLSPAGVLREILAGPTGGSAENDVVWHIRLTRGLGCVLVGGILGAVGSAFQALFRNPLADPYVVGVSSGAAVGAVAATLAGFAAFMGGLGQDAAAFVGGMASLALVRSLSGRRGATKVTTLLLAGVVVGSMLAGLLSLILLASGNDANQLLRWLLGHTEDLMWPGVGVLAVSLAAGATLLIRQARGLNAFAVGEETARRLGVDTDRLKAIVLVTGTAMTAVAVGAAGIIGFLGLVAPHISRSLLGIDWRRSLAGSAVVGAALMLFADVLTQRIIPEVTARLSAQPVIDMPVGVVTALIGAPSLLILLRRA